MNRADGRPVCAHCTKRVRHLLGTACPTVTREEKRYKIVRTYAAERAAHLRSEFWS